MATWADAATWVGFENWGDLDLPYDIDQGTRAAPEAKKGTR